MGGSGRTLYTGAYNNQLPFLFSYMQHLTTSVPLAYEFSCFLDSLLRTVPQISRIGLKVLCRKYEVMFSWYSMRIRQAEKDSVEVQN